MPPANSTAEANPLRRELYVMLFGLIAATGLRISEALALRLDDLLPGGVLRIRQTKFGKSRLVPLHATVVEASSFISTSGAGSQGRELLFPSTKQKELYPAQ